MNKEEMIAVLNAPRERVEYSWGSRGVWYRMDSGKSAPMGGNPNYFDFSVYTYRIKSLAAKRLIRADELPAVFWVRRQASVNPEMSNPWNLVDSIDEYGSLWIGGKINVTKETHVWSPDRLSVKSFYIEEETK